MDNQTSDLKPSQYSGGFIDPNHTLTTYNPQRLKEIESYLEKIYEGNRYCLERIRELMVTDFEFGSPRLYILSTWNLWFRDNKFSGPGHIGISTLLEI